MPDTGSEAAELLQRADPSVTARAAEKLKQEGFDSELSRALEDRLFDPDPEVRALATALFPSFGATASPDLLYAALEDSSPDVVAVAAEALATLKLPRAADALTECLASRPDLAGPLALAMAKLEDPGVEELLLDWLGPPDPPVQTAVLRALAASGTARSVPDIARLLHDTETSLKIEALAALARIRERVPNAVAAKEIPPEIEAMLPELLASQDRHAAVVAIGIIGWTRPEDGPALLLGAIESADPAVRERAREAFGAIAAGAEERVLRAIVEAADRAPGAAASGLDRVAKARDALSRQAVLLLTAHADPSVRERAVALAGRSGGPGVPETLLLLLSDPVGHVRARAAEALGALRHDAAGPALEALLSDPYPDVREAAWRALRALHDHYVDVPLLFERARGDAARASGIRACDPRRSHGPFVRAIGDPSADVRLAAAAALNERGVWLDEAATLLADEDPRVRAHAVRARLGASEPLGLEPLRGVLGDPDVGVRLTLALGLRTATGLERVPWLRQLLHDPCEAVGRAAARALADHKDPDTLGALLDAASTGPLPVAAQAIAALGAVADPEALPRLRALARGGDAAIRELAAKAARRIEGAVS